MKKPNNKPSSLLAALLVLPAILMLNLAVAAGQQAAYNYATGNVQGRSHVGGLIGGVAGEIAVIHNSYARGNVSGSSHVGGFAGSNPAAITHSYASGQVTGDSHTGGFCGSNSGTVTGSYWNTQTSGLNASAGGEGRNTAAMTHPYASNTFVGWDFSSAWQADASPAQNNGYPRLIPSPVYELGLRVYPPGAGTVSGAGIYRANQQAQIAATARSDYRFTGWSREGVIMGVQPGMQMNLSANTVLTAHFEKQATTTGPGPEVPIRLLIYPNPARDLLMVEIPVHETGPAKSVSLVNLAGQVLLTNEPRDPRQTRLSFRVTGITPGIYLLVAVFENGFAVEKVVIQ